MYPEETVSRERVSETSMCEDVNEIFIDKKK
jgi:hypothetical protein